MYFGADEVRVNFSGFRLLFAHSLDAFEDAFVTNFLPVSLVLFFLYAVCLDAAFSMKFTKIIL